MVKQGRFIPLCNNSNAAITYFTDNNFIYAKKDGELFRLALFDQNYYRLRLFNGVPILEIDGLRMHLVRDFKTPLDYSVEVIKKLNINEDDLVLDSCMGLGYTAIEASKKAARVVTFEISNAVYTLATWNPWSEDLFSEKIEIKLGDVSEEIKKLENGSFSIIIHDPPRFSIAPGLYSSAFYGQLYRISKKGARIFHYVGSVGHEKGRKIEEEVMKRLKTAGFVDIRHNKLLQGLFFKKP